MTKLIPTKLPTIRVESYERRKVTHAFGVTLRVTRLRQGMSQDLLSQRCELDRTYPSLMECGKRHPTLCMLLRLADGLGVMPQQLVTDTVSRLRKETP